MELDYWFPPDTEYPIGLGQLTYPPISDQTKNMVVYGTIGIVLLAAIFWYRTRK